MHHKYYARGIILSRVPHGEGGAYLTILTEELGLIRLRAQGVRRSGAKLAHALPTLAESNFTLIRGREGWRLASAVLVENWHVRLKKESRERAARVATLLLRLVNGESRETPLYGVFKEFIAALASGSLDEDAAECLAALRILRLLGLDAGDVPGGLEGYSETALEEATKERALLIKRINRGIMASGL